MALGMQPADWVSFLEHTYLAGFIVGGGSSIKFGVPLSYESRRETFDQLDRVA